MKWFAQTLGGVRSSPLVTSDTVYVGSLDYGFYAFSKADGSPKWKFKADRDIFSSPALGKDGNLYIGTLSGVFYALDPTGHEVWHVDTGEEIRGSPSVDKDGVIYLGTASTDGLKGQLYAFDPTTGEQNWKLSDLAPISASPIIGADGTLYVGSGDRLLLVGKEVMGGTTLSGDFNKNGKVEVTDATRALRMAVGLITPTAEELKIGDVAPKGQPDGKVGVPDVTRILRRAVGLEPDPWP
jgi:outer membrane protein assembly factor BamB